MRSSSPSLAPRATSPSVATETHAASRKVKAHKVSASGSPAGSPSMTGTTTVAGTAPPPLSLPPLADASSADAMASATLNAGKVPVLVAVPPAPPPRPPTSLISGVSGIGPGEAFSNDEQQLNNFIKLHPMLSLEATSQRTLQMLGTMFEKVALQTTELPVVTKSYEDRFLSPALESIGERPCANGDRCLARFVAQVRYGTDTDKAFVCKEFLLPSQYDDFKAGKGLPARRAKCVMCSRYFQNYVYILSRTDPSFKVGRSALGMQVFCNPVTYVPNPTPGDMADAQQAAAELPTHVCSVNAQDGYRPEATLFVDEDWMALRASRESKMGQLLFRPCVRFCSSHYQYVKDNEGLRILQALQRGITSLRARVSDWTDLPDWLVEPNFLTAYAAADPWAVGELVLQLRRAEAVLRSRVAARSGVGVGAVPTCDRWPSEQGTPLHEGTSALPSWAATDAEAQKRMVVALGRLALGAAVEAVLVEKALDLSPPGARGAAATFSQGEGDLAAARIYQDAFLASVWTSAHAQYVAYIQQGVEEPPPPGVATVPSALQEYDFSDLFARRFCQRQCPKEAMPLLQILCRCTNPGSRGWDSLLESALKDSMASRTVIGTAVTVALSGMHPFLHPALRPTWADRMRIQRTAAHSLTDNDVRSLLVATAPSTKEAVRRLLASSIAAVPATANAFAHVKHPIGLMTSPPLRLPHKGMEAAMATFVRAAAFMIGPYPKPYVETVNSCFRPMSTVEAGESAIVLPWELSWLGKGTSATHQKVPLVSIAGDLWNAAFRSNFLLFWAHSASHKLRASRLDTSQHHALHGMNAATKLVQVLRTEEALRVQRTALQNPSSALMTAEEAAQLLGIEGVHGASSNGGSKSPYETLSLLSGGGALGAAKLLAFARAAWVSEELLIVNLGPRTRRKQLKALFARLRRTDYDENTSTPDVLPVHATHLHACTECRRVANALVDHTFKPGVSFTELGVASSMLCTECTEPPTRKTNVRCAKRSSAALRTALTFEETMAEENVESRQIDISSVRALLGETTSSASAASGSASSDSGVAARVRRDAKNALEQRAVATACGERPMLSVPLVGNAVRLWGHWYSLCSFCAAPVRILPEHRFGGELCCGRCEPAMLGVEPPVPSERKNAVCRYCFARDNVRSAARWKLVKTPLDTSGENATLPPPLRTLFYCPSHFKNWIPAAHKVLQTKIILSHLAHNAKPIFSEKEKLSTPAELGFANPVEPKKRKRGKKGVKV